MAKSLFLTGLVLTLVLGACTPPTVPSPPATVPSQTAPSPLATGVPSPLTSPLEGQGASPEIYITYHRSGGFAGTDDTWTISVDGTVTHQGKAPGTPTQLSDAQMAELAAAIRAANFMSLEDSYVPKDSCCDRYQYEITVTINGHSKTVRTIDASPTAPAELTSLVDTLNRLVTAPSPATS